MVNKKDIENLEKLELLKFELLILKKKYKCCKSGHLFHKINGCASLVPYHFGYLYRYELSKIIYKDLIEKRKEIKNFKKGIKEK